MLLPIGDTPNPSQTPYINYGLIAVNIAAFLFLSLPLASAPPDLSDPLLLEYLKIMGVRGGISTQDILQHVSAYDLFVFRYGFRPSDPSITTLFTAMFLHGGWMHLAGNMLFLWIFGDNVEARLGRIRYLLVYLATGIASTLFFTLFVPGSPVPLVGASGAISGVLGCYFLWFPHNQVKTFIFLFPFIITTVLIPARFVLGFYLLVDNLLPFLISAGGAGGVAHGAHIGGFLAGLTAASALKRVSPGRGAFSNSIPKNFDAGGASPVQRISRSIREGKMDQAINGYLELSSSGERRQLSSLEVLSMGEHLLGQQAFPQALSLFRRFIADRPSDPGIDLAYLGAGKALMHFPQERTAASQYFLSALDSTRHPEVIDEARRNLQSL